MAAIDLGEFDALTFDCYGTLIDWERGITETLAPVLARVEHTPDDRLLEAYARHEAALEAGSYLPYREVVSRAMAGVCAEHGVEATAADRGMFGASVGEWPPFDDSVDALRRLSSRYRLGAITNCDDDLFARSAERLDVEFDWVVSAQQAGAYKPNAAMFLLALERIDVPLGRVLHVAQSLFHDHQTAKRLGLATIWIDRRGGRPGGGATPPAEAKPDLTYPDMRSFAAAAVG